MKRGILALVLAGLAALSLVVTKLAIPVMTASLIVFLTLKRDERGLVRAGRVALMIAAPLIVVAVVRFVVVDAMPGMMQGSRKGLTTRAIAALREIRFTQDVLREQAYWDPDGDGVGSAGLLAALSGQRKIRGEKDAPPGLIQRFGPLVDGPRGPFAEYAGYGFIVYLPTPDGKATARPGEPVDDERAERRFLAYAWPLVLDDIEGEHPVLYLDEHERIWISDNRAQGYVGRDKPPGWDAALPRPSVDAVPEGVELTGQDGGVWRPWKGKAPRETLPGDKGAR